MKAKSKYSLKLPYMVSLLLLLLVIAISGAAYLLTGSATFEQCSDQRTQTLQDTCYAEIAILRQDTKICNKIEDEQTIAYCYEKIATATNDFPLCDKVNSTYWKDICFEHFGMQNDDWQICTRIERDDSRDNCFDNIGRDLLMNKWCQQIGDYSKNLKCFIFVGTEKNDVTQCDIMPTPERDFCRNGVAFNTRNIEFCKTISFKKIRSDCEGSIKEKLAEESS